MSIRPANNSVRIGFMGLLFATLTGITLPSISTAAAPDVVKLVVHYQRLAGDYTGWNLWLWKGFNDRDPRNKGFRRYWSYRPFKRMGSQRCFR